MTEIWSLWWAWMAAALLLGIAEVLAPGFIFLGFAIGAAAVSLLLLNLGVTLSLPVLLLIFAALSLAAWFVLRHLFQRPGGQAKIIKDDIND